MLRGGPPIRGEVTVGDLRSLTPFENRIHSTTLSGAELLALFGNLPAPAAGTDGPELFAHVSGARVRYRRDGAPDLVGATVGGAPVVPDREYRVAAPSFAFYRDLFAPLSIDRPTEDHGSQHDALAGYVREVGVVPRLEGRVVATFDRHPDARSL
jgi:2',3'-cyclic-nucleotide 2'-phosphodiesterase (5'-nucleotidase family)